jgi:hypothetical protein
MRDEPSTERRSSLPTILATLILSVLAGLGIAAWITSRPHRASADWRELLKRGEPFVLSWLGNIREGRLTEAYDETTPEARASLDRAGFDAFVADHPGFQTPPVIKSYSTIGGTTGWSLGLNGIRTIDTPSRFVLTAILRPEKDGQSCEIEIVAVKDRESGRLLIDQFKIVPVPPAKP